MTKAKLTVRQMALFAMLGALTFGAKVAMSALPNIEPVTVLVMVYGAVLGRKAIYPVYLYVAMEILFYGIQLWNINYLYVWMIPVIAVWCFRGKGSSLMWALIAGGFGLLFGAFCAPVYLFSGGVTMAVSWWASGIPFDILHGAGNFVMTLILYAPLRKLLTKLYAPIDPRPAQ